MHFLTLCPMLLSWKECISLLFKWIMMDSCMFPQEIKIICWKILLWTEYLCHPSLPQFMYWNPNPQNNDVRRWAFGKCSGHEGGVLIGISTLVKDAPDRFPWPFPQKRGTMRRLWARALMENVTVLAPWAWTLALRTVRDKFLFFISYSIMIFCCNSLNSLKQICT